MPKLQHYFPNVLKPPAPSYFNPNALSLSPQIGIELELENIKEEDIINVTNKTEWKSVTDGSLKNSGMEFTCSVLADNAKEALTNLFDNLSDPKVTKRCSVHIHLNIYDLNEYRIWNIIYLYLIFEKAFYKISGNRWSSNYCVPLQTFLFQKPQFDKLPNILKKYSGLHILADNKLSTLEFRHMHGSTDIEEILSWIKIIQYLYEGSIYSDKEFFTQIIPELRTNSYYWHILDETFKDLAWKFKYPEVKNDIEYGITHTKLLIMT